MVALNRKVVWFKVALLLCVCVPGCTSTRDVSHDAGYLGSAAIGEVYRLRLPAYYYDYNTGRLPFDHYPVAPGYWLLPKTPDDLQSFAEYCETKQPQGIRGILDAGTLLSLNKIIYHFYTTGETAYYVFAICDGSFKGRLVCGNELMEKASTNYTLHLVTKDKYLEPEP